VAAPGAQSRAAFITGWYYQPGLEVPNQSRLRGRAFTPGLAIPVRKPGLKGVSQPGLLPSPTLVCACVVSAYIVLCNSKKNVYVQRLKKKIYFTSLNYHYSIIFLLEKYNQTSFSLTL